MSDKLKPYDEYKESGLLWLDEVPKHWEILRNKNVLNIKKELVGEDSSQYTLLSLTKQGIIARDMVNLKGKFPKEFDTYQSVNSGDIVFCLFDIDETPRTVGLSSLEGMVTGAYTVFEAKSINEKYLYYYYLSLDNNKKLKPLYTGLRKVINTDTFLRTKMPIPPKEEQDKIVKYLDNKLSKINKFIKAKKRQIELLKEQKQAVINKAVTKGLDPNVKMKPSGVEWIGDIPEGWECKQFSKVAKVKSNLVHPKDYEKYIQVSPENIEKNSGILLECKTVLESGIISDNHLFYKGQILYSKVRPMLNKVTIAPFNGLCSADMYPIETHLESEYLLYFMLSNIFLMQLSITENRVKMPKINRKELSDIIIVEPSDINTQKKIVSHIESQITKIDQKIDKITKEITLITEYRTSLISNVVTGKIDVRDIKIEELEEEIEEIDEIDDSEEYIAEDEVDLEEV